MVTSNQRLIGVGSVYGILLVSAFANAVFPDILSAVGSNGIVAAMLSGGGVNPVHLFALFILAWTLLTTPVPALRGEMAFVAATVALIYLPLSWFSWLAVTAIGLRLFLTGRRDIAWLTLYLAFPLFWGLIPIKFIGVSILNIDAYLVSLITGYGVQDNMLIPPNGATPLVVLWGCSSFHGISYAILAWLTFAVASNRKPSSNLHWLAFGIVGIIAINLLRLTLMTVYPEHFDFLHSGLGAEITALILVLWMMMIPFLGQRTSVRHG